MKKLILAFALLTLVGCEKEQLNCNCGRVVEVEAYNYPLKSFVRLKNECSGNLKYFWVDRAEAARTNLGDTKCFDDRTW